MCELDGRQVSKMIFEQAEGNLNSKELQALRGDRIPENTTLDQRDRP
jgi:hypothetical protein